MSLLGTAAFHPQALGRLAEAIEPMRASLILLEEQRIWQQAVIAANNIADLDEAWQIAERGPMRLHIAGIRLYRARLFHAAEHYPFNRDQKGKSRGPKDDLVAARVLIERCGYWRRKEELEAAEEAARKW